jgi:hypothetical protein
MSEVNSYADEPLSDYDVVWCSLILWQIIGGKNMGARTLMRMHNCVRTITLVRAMRRCPTSRLHTGVSKM